MNKLDVVVFNDNDLSLEVNLDKENETIWLTQEQIAELFNRDRTVILKHIKNIFNDMELENKSNVQKMHSANSDKPILLYSLDVIISVGYRVKSKQGIIFRKWANSILKQYLIDGYSINQKRLKYLEKQINLIEVASRLDEKIIAEDGNNILKVIVDYNKALKILDDYDHKCLVKPKGNLGCYQISYEECRMIIDSMKFDSTIFGIEKDDSFKSSINAIYQSAFVDDAYKTIEEKAANLLYFITKNHSFVDGNKRIAASIFLFFLDKNNLIYRNNVKVIDDSTLVAITILIAQSKPKEKEIIVNLIMTFLM